MTYGRLRDLKKHYVQEHPSTPIFLPEAIPCYFCDETMGSGFQNRLVHLARHLEEIALADVPQQYEDWEFYSDTSRESPPIEISPVIMDDPRGPLKASVVEESPTELQRMWGLEQSMLSVRRRKALKQDSPTSAGNLHVSSSSTPGAIPSGRQYQPENFLRGSPRKTASAQH